MRDSKELMSFLCSSVRGLHPAVLGISVPWKTLLHLNIWFSQCLCNARVYSKCFSSPAGRLAPAGQVLCPRGHAASEHLDPCPGTGDEVEAPLLPGVRSEAQALEAFPGSQTLRRLWGKAQLFAKSDLTWG